MRSLFSVSTATAYRDAKILVKSGLAVKTRGGVKLSPPTAVGVPPASKCFFCGDPLNDRAPFVIQLQDGSQRRACCPRCGLMALSLSPVATAVANNFLYGRMVNVYQATFLVGSSVDLCCVPSALCISNEADARRFQTSFGGQVYDLEQPIAQLYRLMALPGSRPAA